MAPTEVQEYGSVSAAHTDANDGWYLYGITRALSGDSRPAWREADWHDAVGTWLGLSPDAEPPHLLEHRGLAAVVRRVSQADFTAEALESRLGDPAWIETMVRGHNAVITAVHQEQPILPVRFGGVYARLEDLTAAMEQRHDRLLAQLERLDGCDEWGVHIYVDPRAVHARVRAERAASPVQHELAGASPGRAYFLRRKLDDGIAARSAQLLDELAQAAYDRLGRLATAACAERPARPSGDVGDEVEALRAALLVHRARRDEFIADLRSCAEDQGGWRCTFSGPWPPYSFVAIGEGSDDDRHSV